MEIAVVGAAASVELDTSGALVSVSVALTAVAPTIIAVNSTGTLLGRQVDDGVLAEVAALASDQAVPISDLRASDTYRRHCIGVMARRAVDAAARRANGESIAVPVNRSLGIGAAS
jgi:CO/xanthine dehydrogenase FAD-binding subunit